MLVDWMNVECTWTCQWAMNYELHVLTYSAYILSIFTAYI